MVFVTSPSLLHPALPLAQGSALVPLRETLGVTAWHLCASLHGLEMQICMLKCTGVEGRDLKDEEV